MGAEPVSPDRAVEALRAFRSEDIADAVEWLSCDAPMGREELHQAGFPEAVTLIHSPDSPTTAEDTRAAARAFLEGDVVIVLFCGGDGTARDLLDVLGTQLPLLGIPAGVKMHSAVFGIHPEAAAATLARFLEGYLPLGNAEVIDLNEEAYRRGEWTLQLHGLARTPQEPNLIQTGKLQVSAVADEALQEEMAEYLGELMAEAPETLFLFGPGGTTHGICHHLGIEATLLGIDALRAGELVGRDLNEAGLLRLLEKHSEAKLVVSPIGAQGFILGRGNLQLSPPVLRRIGLPNLIVVATPAKLRATPVLRTDTGDGELDGYFREKGHLLVVTGYRMMKLHPLQ